ncbi:replication initiator protein A [Gluconacetobacter diazotrophicus]|uniref:Replication initiator protein A n=2 Tax=Gluconacetobacter diazotrophicus TaxID=33996 RepID=A0A7W4NMZ0_GLUDI|nr:replication initiator protein A [Gluconacetobacter diazotrophicus]MBB2158173.1 replication initiator protein A [Gluconacetobacter diazotrophicus]TWA98140.1 replication initiator protein A [Gluconacetobacter diazotrophicus]CAP54340.1 putative replication protein A [Gluconacetobacter diazotrophicus PA1 5]
MMPAADSWRQPDRRFVVTGSARPRDIRDLMGRPFFALGHVARLEPLRYRSRQMEIVVEASAPLGMATIRDADILLWLTGQIVDALNHDLWVSRHVRFTPWRLFQDLGWADGTHQYRRLHGALARLAETRVTTSLRQGPEWREKPFAWISDVRISREDGVALTLPDWLMEMACDRSHVLSVDPAYFRLYGGLERWLYRLARRHAGRQKDGWRFDLRDLHARSGTLSPWRNFVIDVAGIARRQVVPGYDCKVIYGGKQPVLRISPTVLSTGSVDNRVNSTVGQDADHTIAHGAEIPLLTVQKTSQCVVCKSGISPVTYITNIITYYVGDSGFSVSLPVARSGHGEKAREAVADRMVGVP